MAATATAATSTRLSAAVRAKLSRLARRTGTFLVSSIRWQRSCTTMLFRV